MLESILINYVLSWSDMETNSKKSFCLQIGQCHDVQCAAITNVSGQVIPRVTETRHLGVYIVQFPIFKCSVNIYEWSFYRAANAKFGKIRCI